MTYNYTSSDGYVINCYSEDKLVGTLNEIGFTVTKEMIPAYQMGPVYKDGEDKPPPDFSRGKDGIAGILAFKDTINLVNLINYVFDVTISIEGKKITLFEVELIDKGSYINLKNIKPNQKIFFVANKIQK